MALKTQKTRFLQEAWKKAYREGGAELDFEKPGDKQRVRMMLYNAVKLAKQNLDDDAEVNRAAQAIEIVEGDNPLKLYMRLLSESPGMKAVAGLLGHSMDATKDEGVEESLRQLEKLGLTPIDRTFTATPEADAGIEHKANPFYAKRS